MSELDDELEALKARAPDVEIARPPFRPASGPAIRAMAAVSTRAPDKAMDFTMALFTALWREGRNIASQDVIEDIAAQHNVDVSGALEFREAADRWTRTWRDAAYNRIPVLVSPSGAALRGLNETSRIELFLRSGLFGEQSDQACVDRGD